MKWISIMVAIVSVIIISSCTEHKDKNSTNSDNLSDTVIAAEKLHEENGDSGATINSTKPLNEMIVTTLDTQEVSETKHDEETKPGEEATLPSKETSEPSEEVTAPIMDAGENELPPDRN